MRNTLFFFSFLLFLSCVKKEDISKNNRYPVVYIGTLDGKVYDYYGDITLSTGMIVADTVKTFEGHYAHFVVKIKDENWPDIKAVLLTEADVYNHIYDTVPFFGEKNDYPVHYSFNVHDTILSVECKELYNTYFTLDVTDIYGLKISADFEVYVIPNVYPTAIFSAWNSRGLDPHEITIDASESRDWQEKWGGAIIEYEYRINGEIITTTEKSILKYIVPEAGNYKIDVRVKDNEGLWSLFNSSYESKYVSVHD